MVRGDRVADHRVDIYTLGCVGYWLLTGRLVFQAPNAIQVMYQHANAPPIPPSQRSEMEIPPELDSIILACLAKHPEDRPQTAGELSRRLATAVPGTAWTRGAGPSLVGPAPSRVQPGRADRVGQADADQDHGSVVGAGGDTRVRGWRRSAVSARLHRGGSR